MIRLALLLALVASPALAEVPPLAGRVNDNAGLLSTEQREQLRQKLEGIEKSSGHQFVFLSVDSLNGQSIEEFSVATAHAWKLGDKKRDDGLLFVIAKTERKMRLEVGYGLEGSIPDAAAVRMVRDVAAPHLKRGDWAGGVNALFDACEQATKPAPVEAVAANAPAKPKEEGGLLGLWAALAALCGLVWAAVASTRRAERLADARRQARVDAEDEWQRSRGGGIPPRQYYSSAGSSPSPAYVPLASAAASKPRKPEPAPGASYSYDYDSSSSSSTTSYSSDSSSSSSNSDSSSSDSFSGGGGDFGGGGASGDF